MSWLKQGKIFEPTTGYDWMVSHAQVPTALVTKDCFKVYFSTRNAAGKSQIALIDLNLSNPSDVLKLHEEPILTLGKPGTFDEDGVMPSCVLKKGNEIWLYYTGWSQKVTTPYHNAVGLAVSTDGGNTFQRVSDGPLLDRTLNEPYITVTPNILLDQNIHKMWYGSGTSWLKVDGKLEPVYEIKYATSNDGIHWERNGKNCLPTHSREAICTPSVILESGCYKMWYCYRNSEDYRDGSGSYRIGYAESLNGVQWDRKDNQAGIDVSESGWDSTMICYPNVVKHASKLFMFYNGSGFGRTGFGYATKSVVN
jgi:hypothetical protein